MAVVWITHDLGVVAGIADRVAVMYGGRIIEHGRVDDIFAEPGHPYTQALLAARPQPGARADRLLTIAGTPPLPTELPYDIAALILARPPLKPVLANGGMSTMSFSRNRSS